MKYLVNAFTPGMLASLTGQISLAEISIADAQVLARTGDYQSVVGHADTAALFSAQLEVEVKFNRQTVKISSGDELLLGQYTGPRLPEGVTTLPDDASIRWCLVRATLA